MFYKLFFIVFISVLFPFNVCWFGLNGDIYYYYFIVFSIVMKQENEWSMNKEITLSVYL